MAANGRRDLIRRLKVNDLHITHLPQERHNSKFGIFELLV